jgi:8-oxo-dGTP pyrophosphatase MutT (NUDIX family)
MTWRPSLHYDKEASGKQAFRSEAKAATSSHAVASAAVSCRRACTTGDAIVARSTATTREPFMAILSINSVFSGRVIQVNVECVQLPNGSIADLEIIHHPGGAAVVALDANRNVCLLRQFRHAANGYLWELPAGKIDNKEPPLETARRELSEEAGASAVKWESLGDYVSSPGVFTEVVHLFLATGLQVTEQGHEEHEVIEVHWKPLDEAVRLARNGEIRDGKTLVGIFRAAAHLCSEASI